MRRWRIKTRRVGSGVWREAGRCWTRAGAERWALAHQDRLLDYWFIDGARSRGAR